MNNFNTLLNAVESYILMRLDGHEREAFINAIRTIKDEFKDTLDNNKSLESFICFLITHECEYLLKRPVFVVWSDPNKYKLMAYGYALDIVESLDKRFSSDIRRW